MQTTKTTLTRREMLLVLLASAVTTGCARIVPRAGTKPASPAELILCGADEVFILSLKPDVEPRKIWSWRATDCPDIPAALHRSFRATDDCKPVEGGRKILVSSSQGAVALVERETRRALFYAPVINAHSIELLPRGRIAAASSVGETGNRVILFDIATRKELASDRLSAAHGVVWDQQREFLWALGNDELRAYRVTQQPSGGCEMRMEFQTNLPENNGHDLVPVPGSARLFLSTGKHGWYFDRDSRRIIPHEALADTPKLKCYSVHAVTGRIAYVQAEGTNWWAERVHFLNPAGELHLPGQRLYKARWL